MIHSVRGIICAVSPTTLHVDVGGVEYILFISRPASQSFEALLETTQRVLTYLHITDRSMELYGFASASERTLFLALLKVDGIGPKAALKIVGHTTADEFFTLVHSCDVQSLAKLPGIGAKKANKILVALENVFVASEPKVGAAVEKKRSIHQDISAALLSMGYQRSDIERVMEGVFSAGKTQEQDEAQLMKTMIIELAKLSPVST